MTMSLKMIKKLFKMANKVKWEEYIVFFLFCYTHKQDVSASSPAGQSKVKSHENKFIQHHFEGGRVMVFKATFNNISVISWRSVLMVEETGENHRPATMHHLKKIYFYRSILNIDHLQDSTILDVTLILLKLLFKKSRPVTCDLICFLILL